MLFFSMMLLMLPLLAQKNESVMLERKITGEVTLPTKDVTAIATDAMDVTFTTVYNDVKEALSGLSKGLQVGGEHVYDVLVKQQRINSYIWITLLPFTILFAILFVRCLQTGQLNFAQIKKDSGYSYPDWYSKDIVLSAVTGILALTFITIFFAMISDGLMGFINPEYGAIREILSSIK